MYLLAAATHGIPTIFCCCENAIAAAVTWAEFACPTPEVIKGGVGEDELVIPEGENAIGEPVGDRCLDSLQEQCK